MAAMGRVGRQALWGLFVATATMVASAPAGAPANPGLLEALDAATAESEARTLLEPYMSNLKSLDPQALEKCVLRQWWDLSREVVAASHTQQVDLSFVVRKAVRSLKDEADELLRTLNPKYGMAQQVAPAFQWAQNDTCIFLTIKYTVRWNAPGALEVTDPSVNMSENSFRFSGLGKHSNNKYRYELSLNFFDNIASQSSSWSAASVGKLSVTLRKRWPRKWPRLLDNKKTKIANMHVWMEMQEKLDSALGGMTSASNSPITCAASDKLYCLATDTCKKAANCSQCPGKTVPKEEEHVCTGMPTEKASIAFKDRDTDEHELGGPVTITKARNEFDIDTYLVYFGKDDRNKLETAQGTGWLVGEAPVSAHGGDTEVKMPMNTALPERATHLLVFSKNEYGEYATPGSVILKDAVLPKAKPGGIAFEDEDGEKGEVSGTVTVSRAEDQAQLDEYALHWGKSATKKLASSSFLRDISKQDGRDPSHYIAKSTKIPDGATHLLVFSKNEHGEHPSPASLKFRDNTKPCLTKSDNSCARGISSSPDTNPDAMQVQTTVFLSPAQSQDNVTHYAFYWGKGGCESAGAEKSVKNGHIEDRPVGNLESFDLGPAFSMPEGTTHLLVFSKNKYGESDHCVSSGFEDLATAGKKEL
mmetsp:Transcript_89947/g.183410  ORF Transcript_89947/g.183410 Transcript_89947/m.183410 type:complete len:646 (+) Transcript_89947:92-2029(+)